MKPLGDRRARVRFEVVGALFGSLDVMEPACIVNISPLGALIASSTPLPLGSSPSLSFEIDGTRIAVPVLVRHVRRLPESGGAEFHIGVEFVSFPESLLGAMGVSTEFAGD